MWNRRCCPAVSSRYVQFCSFVVIIWLCWTILLQYLQMLSSCQIHIPDLTDDNSAVAWLPSFISLGNIVWKSVLMDWCQRSLWSDGHFKQTIFNHPFFLSEWHHHLCPIWIFQLWCHTSTTFQYLNLASRETQAATAIRPNVTAGRQTKARTD
mgnify:CR=1 FL=1